MCGKVIYYKDKKYGFVEYFDETSGFLARSNILQHGIETDKEPTMRSYPELIDVGIMGSCTSSSFGVCKSAGVDCYQNAETRRRPNMSVTQFERIVSQCKGRSFQVALGGAGDPNKHESFEQILSLARENLIVPNLTTSGFLMSENEISLIKKYCGAVAVSFYSRLKQDETESNPFTITAIKDLVSAGCVTNIHYVLSKQSIGEAIYRLRNNMFPEEINAVVFLLYKPVGQANKDKMLTIHDPSYILFLQELDRYDHPFKIGFDSCQSPAIRSFCPSVANESLEFCEAARFSMYVDCELNAFPCSFGHELSKFSVDLNSRSIIDAWNSEEFNYFRDLQKKMCRGCEIVGCRNCALGLSINMCEPSFTRMNSDVLKEE